MRYFAIAAAALAASCASAPTPSSAQSGGSGQTPPPPPCQSEDYRAFDFWLGTWNVTSGGKQAGVNRITREEGGCLIIERWTGASGGTGQSYNFFDPGMQKWRQVWVSGFGTIDYAGGLDDEGRMVLEGDIAYRNGQTALFRGTWTKNDDGTVTQHFQQQDAESGDWKDWFIGEYAPMEDAAAEAE